MTRQIVQDLKSGEKYAVRFEGNGTVYMSEALRHTETELNFDDYEYDNEETEWYNAQEWQVIRNA